MRIKGAQTKSGESLEFGPLTVLVGPNNVGKSRTLRDIHQQMTQGQSAGSVILTDVDVELPTTMDELLSGLDVAQDPQDANYHLVRSISSNLVSGHEMRVHLAGLKENMENPEWREDNRDYLFQQFGRFRVALLDAESRLQIASSSPSYDPATGRPERLLQSLYYAPPHVEETLREAFDETFGMQIRLDYSTGAMLRFRVTRRFPNVPEDPRKAYPIMAKFPTLDEQGDGFRSFTAVILSLLMTRGRTILLDEPEAFLHPAQARHLGHWVATLAADSPGGVIVATHNAHFLAGLLLRGEDLAIYRLNRQGDDTSFSHIAPADIERLGSSPLLSSQRVLEAVFHRGVAVCEADSDRLVYQTVASIAHGNRDVLFLHAHNKQTLKDVIGLLRAADIPCVAIPDIDLLRDGGDLAKLLEALAPGSFSDEIAGLREAVATCIDGQPEAQALAEVKDGVAEFMDQLNQREHDLAGARSRLRDLQSSATPWKAVKLGGVDAIPAEVRENAKSLLDLLRARGAFLVPVGELESWIELGTRRKNRWIVLALPHLFDKGPPKMLVHFVGDILEHVSPEDEAAAGAP